MTQPGLWLYGLQDIQQPSKLDIDRLQELIDAGKDFAYVAFAEANHNLAVGGNYCMVLPVVDFVTPMFTWISAHTGL